MSTLELKKQLIDKIQKTDNDHVLHKAYRLLELETADIENISLVESKKD